MRLWLSFQEVDEIIWYDVIVIYLKDDIIPDKIKIWKFVQNEKDHFKIKKDIITNKS